VIDVDGCFTPGYQIVDAFGQKPFKVFGLDDYAALVRWNVKFEITAITSDYSPPTVARFKSWAIALEKVSDDADERVNAIEHITEEQLTTCVYIGDGYHDADVMRHVGFGLAPADAWPETARIADAVISAPGGRRAVALALDFIGENLLKSPGPT
jgi:YrbI family 3-deoxy-D-manno-octulosonate 8-phosphate phosphatase